MLAGSLVSRRDEIGIFYPHFCRVFSSLKLHLRHDEVFGVREAFCLWTNKHKITNLLWVLECNTQGNIATVRTPDECSLRYFSVSNDGRNIVGFVIRFLGSWRVSIPASIVTYHVESFAESGPYVIPHG